VYTAFVLARGHVSLVLGAVAAARNNAAGASGRKASPEFSEMDYQPSVSLGGPAFFFNFSCL
jgi:hypothetical protein